MIEVRSRAGFPVTQLASETQGPGAGRFRATLAPGDYTLLLRSAQRPDRRLEVTVAPGAVSEVPPQALEPLAFLRFEPAFADGGPGRVIVTGVPPTPDPIFGAELLGFRIDGARPGSGSETRDLYFVGGPSDPVRVPIAPGRYRLVATRGLEHGLGRAEVELAGGGRGGSRRALRPAARDRAARHRERRSARARAGERRLGDAERGAARELRGRGRGPDRVVGSRPSGRVRAGAGGARPGRAHPRAPGRRGDQQRAEPEGALDAGPFQRVADSVPADCAPPGSAADAGPHARGAVRRASQTSTARASCSSITRWASGASEREERLVSDAPRRPGTGRRSRAPAGAGAQRPSCCSARRTGRRAGSISTRSS